MSRQVHSVGGQGLGVQGSHIEQLLHQLSVGVQVSPWQAAEVCVVQVEKVLGCTGRAAALTVLHHTQP